MTLRPGSYDAAPPVWRGVIRLDSFPAYVCVHNDHPDQRAATKCARAAYAQLRDEGTLAEGWYEYHEARELFRVRCH